MESRGFPSLSRVQITALGWASLNLRQRSGSLLLIYSVTHKWGHAGLGEIASCGEQRQCGLALGVPTSALMVFGGQRIRRRGGGRAVSLASVL